MMNMAGIRRLAGLLIAVCLLCTVLAACGNPAKPSTKEDLVEKIAVTYGTKGNEAKEELTGMLNDLREQDPHAADQWEKILNYWDYANNELRVHYDILPDGLVSSGELCLVALGFQLKPDGSMQEELIERLKVVLASAQKYPNAWIVCTGGGTAAGNPEATEAGKMAEWLIQNGIPAERIIVEDKSITTAQNAMFSYALVKEQHPEVNKFAIISSDYHIPTGALFFQAWFILQSEDPAVPVATVISDAAWEAPEGSLSTLFQAGGLIELSGDEDTAFDIYYDQYDIHELPTRESE